MIVNVSTKRTAALLLAWLAAGCEADGVILEFRTSNLRVDGLHPDVNGVDVCVRRKPDGPYDWNSSFTLAKQPDGVTLGRLGLVHDGGDRGLFIDVTAFVGARPMILRRIQTELRQGLPQVIPVDLDRECIGVRCPDDSSTCVPRFGCTSPKWPPSYEARGPTGESCDCTSLFPICVDANWTYEMWAVQPTGRYGPEPHLKSWSVPQFTRIPSAGMPRGGLENGFVQFRNFGTDFANRWLTRDARGLWWRYDELYRQASRHQPCQGLDNDHSVVFMGDGDAPGKLRVDETKTRVGQPWPPLRYTRVVMPRQGDPAVERHLDEWAVVDPSGPEVLGPGARELPHVQQRLRMPGVVCHRRDDSVPDATPPRSARQYFCFLPGVGKIYENDVPNRREEILTNTFVIPGCPKVTLPGP